jgi:hypothetical protein
MANLGLSGCVRKIFATEVQFNKLLRTRIDAFGCALSNKTTFKLFYHADVTNLPDLRGHALCNMVHGNYHRILVDKRLPIPRKDSPSSMIRCVLLVSRKLILPQRHR